MIAFVWRTFIIDCGGTGFYQSGTLKINPLGPQLFRSFWTPVIATKASRSIGGPDTSRTGSIAPTPRYRSENARVR